MTHRDHALYRRMSEPFKDSEETLAAIQAFESDIRAARERHKIPNVAVAFSLGYTDKKAEGGEVHVEGSFELGDGTKAEWLHRSAAIASRKRLEQSLEERTK